MREGGTASAPTVRLDVAPGAPMVNPRALGINWDPSAARYQLYGTASGAGQRGLHALGEGLPYAAGSVAPSLLPGMETGGGVPHQW